MALRVVPVDEGARLDPPEWLTNAQKVIWLNTLDELRQLGIADTADRDALAQYAVVTELAQRLARAVASLGSFTAYNAAGTPVAHPLLVSLDRAQARAMRYAREFGLTPSARGALHAGKQDTEAANASPAAFYRAAM